MQRWKLTIEYDGSAFCGWQRQAQGISVQQVMEEATKALCGHDVRFHVAGRTDSGVHARGQVAHVDLPDKYTPNEVRNALNVYARPHAVSVLDAEKVSEEFHARFGAQKRYYRYVIVNRPAPLAIGRDYAWHVRRTLNIDAMQQAGNYLLGLHDFTSFRATECQAKSPIRSIERLEISRDGDYIYTDLEAKSFLHHQVRNIMGTLAKIGVGKWPVDIMPEILEAKDRSKAGPTAPPNGLFFVKVDY